jgi:hypothetical protein
MADLDANYAVARLGSRKPLVDQCRGERKGCRRGDVTRSIGHTYRLVRLAAAAAALVSVGLASACGAGQLAATSRIVPAVPGGGVAVAVPNPPNPQNPDSQVQVEDAVVVYSSNGYPMGGTAPLAMRVFNQTDSPITIAPGSVQLLSTQPGTARTNAGTLTWAVAASTQSVAPSGPASAPAPSGSASAPASAAPSATAAAAAAPPLTIAPGSFVILDPSQSQYLVVTGLTSLVTSGNVLQAELTAVYKNQPYSLAFPVTFAPPSSSPPRVPASGVASTS